MGCKGCDKPRRDASVDRHGNIRGSENDLDKQEEIINKVNKLRADDVVNPNITYEEYLTGKTEHRKKVEVLGKEAVKYISEDIKRIRITELVAMYNCEEFGVLTPGQAISALYTLLDFPEYKQVFTEFEGLENQIREKFEELKSKKISLIWKK